MRPRIAVDSQVIAMKPAKDPKRNVAEEEKAEILRERVNNISCHLTYLQDRFGSDQVLLRYYTMLSSTDVADADACNVAAASWTCILCAGSGLLLRYYKPTPKTPLVMETCPLCHEI